MDEEYFIPDTNLFIHDSEKALTSWKPKDKDKKNILVLTIPLMRELDKLKKGNDDVGYHARESIRSIKQLISDGASLSEGIEKNGITYKCFNYDECDLPHVMGYEDNIDSYFVRLALKLKNENKKVEFVTLDGAPYIVADMLGIKVSDWEHVKAVKSIDQIYKGWEKLSLEDRLFSNLIKHETFTLDEFKDKVGYEGKIFPNMYFNLKNESSNSSKLLFYANPFKSNTIMIENITDYFEILNNTKLTRIKGVNTEQLMALHALSNKKIDTVFILGVAGTGKTFLAVDSGYNQTYTEREIASNIKIIGSKDESSRYDKLLITRPVFEIGEKHGYLPGSMGEKYAPWAQPIMDNLKEIIDDPQEFKRLKEKGFMNDDDDSQIEIAPLAYARGRSRKGVFWIVDEAQNTRYEDMKTLGTRAGEGSKMVVVGDPQQQDTPYITPTTCGLVYYSEAMKEDKTSATILLQKVKRGPIAEKFARF